MGDNDEERAKLIELLREAGAEIDNPERVLGITIVVQSVQDFDEEAGVLAIESDILHFGDPENRHAMFHSGLQALEGQIELDHEEDQRDAYFDPSMN